MKRIFVFPTIGMLLLAVGCGGVSSTNVVTMNGGSEGTSVINGQTFTVKDGVLSFDGESFDIPKPSSVIKIESRDGEVRVTMDGEEVYPGSP